MRKASIITLHYIDNFGSVLQAYATQEVFKNFGYETEIVNYIRENHRYSFLKKEAFSRYRKRDDLFSFYILARLLQIRWCLIFKIRTKAFNRFRNKHLHLSKEYNSLLDLKQNPPVADIYVTGSDQVWNIEYNGGVLEEYYLEYAPYGFPKIALSASIGTENINDEDLNLMIRYLSKYDRISVRELSAMELLKSAGCENIECLIDPTLMLAKYDWISKLGLQESAGDYVFMYQLNENPTMLRFAEKIANDNHLKLLIISPHCKHANCNFKIIRSCGVEKFLNLILGARYVVTDSFHGTAFSFNFNKDVFVFYPPRYKTRIESFIRIIQSEHRLVVDNLDWKNYDKIDFPKVNRILNYERERVKAFLNPILNK